jgi:hypothetical protein
MPPLSFPVSSVFRFYAFDIFLMSQFVHVILGDIYVSREYGRNQGSQKKG